MIKTANNKTLSVLRSLALVVSTEKKFSRSAIISIYNLGLFFDQKLILVVSMTCS